MVAENKTNSAWWLNTFGYLSVYTPLTWLVFLLVMLLFKFVSLLVTRFDLFADAWPKRRLDRFILMPG